ncbi:hypothetical protein BaRGS_00009576 [Batillaria attramentaria]|uniref:Major facilitator superfamily (MFS) profile domain-containing protein n=1 Tax=Batillaria attramentaria TaxID=370345 RepID=A0ABD0LIJ4_9CAEN
MATDKGWAWVVLVASLGANFLNGTLVYFVGVVHTGLLRKFQSSVTTTAWVGAIYSSLMCLAAPLASVVISRFGCRVCCVVGGVLCFTGFTASAFVTSIGQLFFTYGLLAGVGLGLTYAATVITVGYYFDKYRGLASGISSGAAAVGILSGSLIAQTLMDEYSVSGAFLMIAALSLHFALFGMFFRPTVYEGGALSVSVHSVGEAVDVDMKASTFSLAIHGVSVVRTTSLRSGLHGAVDSIGSQASVTVARLQDSCIPHDSVGNLSSTRNQSYREETSGWGSHKKLSHCQNSLRESNENRLHMPNIVVSDNHVTPACDTGLKNEHQCVSEPLLLHDDVTKEKPCIQKATACSKENVNNCDAVHEADVTALGVPGNECTESESRLELQKFLSKVAKDITDGEKISITITDDYNASDGQSHYAEQNSLQDKGPLSVMSRLKQSVGTHMSIVSNKAFMFHCASVLAANINIGGVYLHLPEYAMLNDTTPTQAAALFVAVGVLSLLSRLAAGFATTDPRIDPLTLNMGMMGLCGLSAAFFPYYSETYTGQMVFAALFGLYTGGQYALVSVLTVQFVGVDMLPTAFGIKIFIMGIGYVGGPPLAAMIVDNGGTYEYSFVFLGAIMVLGSVLDLAAIFFSNVKPTTEDDVKATVDRDWLGSNIVISVQEPPCTLGSLDLGSVASIRSRFSHTATS